MVLRISATDLSFPTWYKLSFCPQNYRFLDLLQVLCICDTFYFKTIYFVFRFTDSHSVFLQWLCFFQHCINCRFCLQNYRFLDLLQVLCVCDGVAIPNNQSYIVEQWLRESRVRNRPRPHKTRQTLTPYTATIMTYQPLFSSDMFIKQRIYFMLLVFFSCALIVSRTACI